MEQDRNLDASLTAFNAPSPPIADPAAAPPAAGYVPSASFDDRDDLDVDWDPPQVRDSVVWGFRAFVAFAALVFFMFLGQLLSGDDTSSNQPSSPSVSTPVGADGTPAQDGGATGLSGDGF